MKKNEIANVLINKVKITYNSVILYTSILAV